MNVLEVVAVGALAMPLTLAVLLICYGAKHGAMHLYRKWRIARSGIAYEPLMGQPILPKSPVEPTLHGANLIAAQTAERLLGVAPTAFEFGKNGFAVRGGATGHTYRILPRALFPVVDLTSRTLLCAKPFNSWHLPMADVMLTQALYLQCPETERAFVALCNKTAAPSVALIH